MYDDEIWDDRTQCALPRGRQCSIMQHWPILTSILIWSMNTNRQRWQKGLFNWLIIRGWDFNNTILLKGVVYLLPTKKNSLGFIQSFGMYCNWVNYLIICSLNLYWCKIKIEGLYGLLYAIHNDGQNRMGFLCLVGFGQFHYPCSHSNTCK